MLNGDKKHFCRNFSVENDFCTTPRKSESFRLEVTYVKYIFDRLHTKEIEGVVPRRKLVAHAGGSRAIGISFIRGRDGSADEENRLGPGLVALSLGIGSYVESAGASSRRWVSPRHTRRLITSSREVPRVRSRAIQSNAQ